MGSESTHIGVMMRIEGEGEPRKFRNKKYEVEKKGRNKKKRKEDYLKD